MAKKAKMITLFFMGSAVVLAIAVGVALYLRSGSVHENCEGVNEVKTALIKIMTRAEQLSLSNPDYTEVEKHAAVLFYNRGIEDLEPKTC